MAPMKAKPYGRSLQYSASRSSCSIPSITQQWWRSFRHSLKETMQRTTNTCTPGSNFSTHVWKSELIAIQTHQGFTLLRSIRMCTAHGSYRNLRLIDLKRSLIIIRAQIRREESLFQESSQHVWTCQQPSSISILSQNVAVYQQVPSSTSFSKSDLMNQE